MEKSRYVILRVKFSYCWKIIFVTVKIYNEMFATVLYICMPLIYPFELTIMLAGQQTVMNPGAGQASKTGN